MLERQDHLTIAAEAPSAPAELARARGLLAGWEVAHIRVHARCDREIPTPFAGSLIRGGLGAALRQLGPGDLYEALFEPAAGGRGSGPRPFAVVPPGRIAPGPVDFELKLFGLPPWWQEALIAAVAEMARAGIGRDRVPLAIEGLESFRFPGSRLMAGADLPGTGSVAVVLRTPLRMKEAGRVQSELTPERLVRASLRRLTDIGAALGQEWPRAWPATLEAAREVRVDRADLRWLDWGRYSMRQGRPMRLGGTVGEMVLSGLPENLVALLRAGAFAGLGKSTSFGLGAIEIREVP
jgi:hypothetical protein